MSPTRRFSQSGYYPSEDKKVVREQFDLPLIESVAQRENRKIRYFGLPGEEALDLRCWGHLCEYVAAVEVFKNKFQIVKHVLRTQFGNLSHRAHLGDVDKIIMTNKSGDPPRTFVSTNTHEDVGYIWDFDVVYLDYFGKFLPYNRGGKVVRNRADAIRRLFSLDRQDGRRHWLFMLTVESKLTRTDKNQMRSFLTTMKNEADRDTKDTIDFMLNNSIASAEQAARLVHGTLSCMIAVAATNSDVRVAPRPTVLYKGSHGTPMLHFAYEIYPDDTLAGNHPVLPLLRSPLLRVTDNRNRPWFRTHAAPTTHPNGRRYSDDAGFSRQ